jgi:Fe2+ transport system protein B
MSSTDSLNNRKPMKSSLFGGNNNNNNNSSHRRGNSANNNNNSSDNTNNNPQQDVEDVIRENDTMLKHLQTATGRMHDEATRLRNEAKEHNAIVDQLLKGLGSASNSIRGTVTKLDQVMAKHGCSGTFVLGLIVFVLFVLLFYISKYAWNASRAAAAVELSTTTTTTTMAPPPLNAAGGN